MRLACIRAACDGGCSVTGTADDRSIPTAPSRTRQRHQAGTVAPEPLDYASPQVRGELRPLCRQGDRAIDWAGDGTGEVLRKIRSADGNPGGEGLNADIGNWDVIAE